MEIVESVKKMLESNFSEYPKRTIKLHRNYMRFACPYCGDSHDNMHKKRGTVFFSNYSFHCYNCNHHTNAIQLLKDFKAELPKNYDEYLVAIKQYEHTKKSMVDYADYSDYSILGIDIDEYASVLKWRKATTNDSFIIERHLKHCLDNVYFNRENKPILVNLIGNKMIGYQVRVDRKDVKYDKYNLDRIYNMMGLKIDNSVKEKFDRLNELSLIYGFFQLNFDMPITIFEGAINSYFYPNSIATSTINSTFYDSMKDLKLQFFFDNDKRGKDKMLKLLHNGHSIFLWSKFISDYNLQNADINDMNDIVKYCLKNGKDYYKYTKNYFSNKILDSIYL